MRTPKCYIPLRRMSEWGSMQVIRKLYRYTEHGKECAVYKKGGTVDIANGEYRLNLDGSRFSKELEWVITECRGEAKNGGIEYRVKREDIEEFSQRVVRGAFVSVIGEPLKITLAGDNREEVCKEILRDIARVIEHGEKELERVIERVYDYVLEREETTTDEKEKHTLGIMLDGLDEIDVHDWDGMKVDKRKLVKAIEEHYRRYV